MIAIDLAPLLYASFVESEDPRLVGAPEWRDLVVETRARWMRMAFLLQTRIVQAADQSTP